MKKEKEYRTIFGHTYEVMNYKGILMQKNPLTNLWTVFPDGMKMAPQFGKKKEVEEFIDDFEVRNMLDVLRQY
jgi:hypothetical protein